MWVCLHSKFIRKIKIQGVYPGIARITYLKKLAQGYEGIVLQGHAVHRAIGFQRIDHMVHKRVFLQGQSDSLKGILCGCSRKSALLTLILGKSILYLV